MYPIRSSWSAPLSGPEAPAWFLAVGTAAPSAAQGAGSPGLSSFETLFGLAELPFLLLAVCFALATATALKGGAFGRGMGLIAWGFLVMAVGHLHMLVERIWGFNVFTSLFGISGGAIVWIVGLIASWTLSWLGFHSIYKAGKES